MADMINVPVSGEAAEQATVAEKAAEPARSFTKMHLHVTMLALTGVMTMVMLHLHMDQTDSALFSFGPLGPSLVTEVVDFIKGL
jgi:hypothetical protein